VGNRAGLVAVVKRQTIFPPGIENRFSGSPASNIVTVVTLLYKITGDIWLMRKVKSVLVVVRRDKMSQIS
jgi:hypothetical protein